MAAVEAMGPSGLCQLESQTLTEISDDEVNLTPSEDEEDEVAAGKVAAVMESAAENTAVEEGAAAAMALGDEALKFDTPVNGVMVLTLLDKIIGAVDQIQQTQSGLEARQQEMERSVTGIQGELTKLSKSHGITSNSVNKMMEKVQKVSVNVKTVRTNLEKQGGQIKKLEANEAELLKRRNFKVMVYQNLTSSRDLRNLPSSRDLRNLTSSRDLRNLTSSRDSGNLTSSRDLRN
ncbi:hypothetical protein CRUP_020778, partial [Coryphaenoides rupestris]